jgi:hypothetical protein
MSVESRHQDNESRPLRDEEQRLLTALLKNRADFPTFKEQIANGKVSDMPDGGMGSVKFVSPDARVLGVTLVEAEYLDVDGVLVSIAVNADDDGRLYEMDFWKTNFSALKQYPRPEVVKIKTS